LNKQAKQGFWNFKPKRVPFQLSRAMRLYQSRIRRTSRTHCGII